MTTSRHRFDPYLEHVGADKLKRMVPTYGGLSKMRKQECIDWIRAALAVPERMRKAVESLEPFEQNALAMAKQSGGSIAIETLGVGVLASGAKLPNRLLKRNDVTEVATHMINRGLFLSSGYSPDRIGSWNSRSLFTDPRLLEHAGLVQVETAEVQAASSPAATVVRMPPTVVLEIIGFLQAVETMGGLGLTQKDELRVSDVKKLRKALQWKHEDVTLDGFLFKDAVYGLLYALSRSDFLERKDRKLRLKTPVEEFAKRDYSEQVSTLLNGFLRLEEWTESGGKVQRHWQSKGHQGCRRALLYALASFPAEKGHFYTIDALDELLYARIGERYSLGGSVHKYFSTYGKSPAEVKQMHEAWQSETRQKWLQKERLWIEDALTTWLYYLGMVELGVDGGTVVSFRLTELGKAILHPNNGGQAVAQPKTQEDSQGVWIVQPNFEIVVYLDRTTPTQLAFLERHATRTESQQYTAHYRLTQNSVYQGLESGTALDELIRILEESAQAPLPQNVIVEVQEWASRREQVVLRHRANLLEFPDSAARQAILNDLSDKERNHHKLIGDRFLLVSAATIKSRYLRAKANSTVKPIDYKKPLKKILSIEESGRIVLDKEPDDLFLTAQLDQWAERINDGAWQLTKESVAQRIAPGIRIDQLTELLAARIQSSRVQSSRIQSSRFQPEQNIPALLAIALRNWAKKRKSDLELEPVVVLRCTSSTVLDAIQNSAQLKPYLRGQLEEDTLAFDSTKLKELQKVLEWAGFELDDLLYW